MIPKDYQLFPDPKEENGFTGIDESKIKDVFIVLYHEDGSEMMSFRKSYVEIKKVNVQDMVSMIQDEQLSIAEEISSPNLKKKYRGE